MTIQMAEKLLYEGEEIDIRADPLSNFFRLTGYKPRFAYISTDLRCGYLCEWAIIDSRLYLTSLYGELERDRKKVTLDNFFSVHADRVLASWYTGQIKYVEGKVIRSEPAIIPRYVKNTYERDVTLTITRGFLTDKEVISNRP